MNDQNQDNPQDDQYDPQEDQPSETDKPSPQSRLDRLMGAKDRSEKEAERWSEIEQRGAPLPSHDQDYGVTQQIITEPPRKEGDTPTGRETPPEGTHRPELPTVTDTPSGQATPQGQPKVRPSSGSQVPHPTDPPVGQDHFVEPPMPNNLDQGPGGRATGGSSPPQRYQPPRKPGDVRVDANGMPLPKRVPREDLDATMAGASSYSDELYEQPEPTRPHGYDRPEFDDTRPSQPQQAPPPEQQYYAPPEQQYYPPQQQSGRARLPEYSTEPPPPPTRYIPQQPPARSRRRRGIRSPRMTWGCLARTMLLSFIGGLVALMLTGGGAAIYYARVTAPAFRDVQTIADLQARSLQFETTRIRDREGNVLYEVNDPQGGRRDYVTLDEISPYLIMATVATEERDFFTNPGFSVPAIVRAVYQNYREGEVVSGASTITQQLTRMLLLDEDERFERSYDRKIKEIFLAAELGRRFSKQDILELYLNQAFYGNHAYGIEAAAQTYFNKSAKDLTMVEAAFLAGIPQAPAYWDPVTNKEAVLYRQQVVLGLMHEAGCLDTGNTGLVLPCVGDAEIAAAGPEIAAITAREFQSPEFRAKYPHWVFYVLQQIERDPTIGQAIYTSGFDIYTTLDPRLQDLAQLQVDTVLSGLQDRNVHNASVVVLDTHTGAILAMVGSRDFNDETIDGQVNIALSLQQPGSSIKPFTYLTSFRKGWTPATVIWDVPIAYEIPGFGVYEPVNYSGAFWGPVSVRTALSNSLNVPAVETLDYVGVPALLDTLNDLGISSLGDATNPQGYGLSLTLGAGEIYLLEWTNAFNAIANAGLYRPTYAIERVERDGVVIEGYPYQVPPGEQRVEAEYAYLIRDIMADKEARVPSFGTNSPLSPSYPAGAKTGTTNDFRDNWTMGFTSELAVGVWVGNTDNSPMINVSGVTGAGPIWRGILDGSQQWYPAQAFIQPPGVQIQQTTICMDDGALPSEYCQQHSQVRPEIFAAINPPPPIDQGLYRRLRVNEFTGLIANDFCPTNAEERLFLFLPNPSQLIDMPAFERAWLLNTDEGRGWATQRGLTPEQIQSPAPTDSCNADTQLPEIVIVEPQEGQTYSEKIQIRGTADAANFSHYFVDFGLGPDPEAWGVVQSAVNQPVHDGVLAELDLRAFENGVITIRIVVVDQQNRQAEKRVTFLVENPTPTPEETKTEKPTRTPRRPSETPEPTAEPN